MTKYIMSAFRLDKKLKDDLKKLSDELTVSQSAIVRMALRAFINKYRR